MMQIDKLEMIEYHGYYAGWLIEVQRYWPKAEFRGEDNHGMLQARAYMHDNQVAEFNTENHSGWLLQPLLD